MAVSAHDVAAYILQRQGGMTAMKLQKLVYYSQAWHLVWDEEPLFREPVQAWANGPVVYALFDEHRGRFTVDAPWPVGDVSALSASERETVDLICEHYGKLSGQALSALTHAEAPWRRARAGLSPTARSSVIIELDEMAEYYGALAASEDEDVSTVDELDWREYEREMRQEYELEMRREYEADMAADFAPDPHDYM